MNNFILWIMDIYQKMMDLVSEALPWLNEQYKNLIIGGSGVILIYILYKLFLAGSNRQEYKLPPPDKPLKPKEKEQYRKIADKLAQKGEFIKAGDLYRIIGDASRAIEMYKKSGKTMMAAQIAIDFDLHEIAAALLENMSKCLEAAEEWAKAGNFAKAAECYLKEKSFIKAAETLSKAKQHEKAGDIYIQGGYFDKAATEYIAAKNYKKAAQAFLKLYYSEKKNLENNQNVSPGKINALKKLALKCANYLELAGNIEKALEMYEEGGNFNKAAELAGQLEMWEKAAEYYQMGGLPLKAAEIYDRLGDKKRAAQIRAEIYEKEGNELAAAENYIQSGDYLAAAEILKRHGKYDKAAILYEKAGDFALAGDMYTNSGQFEKAAEAYEKAGDYATAAEMFRKANNVTKLLEMLIKSGKIPQAIEVSAKKGLIDNVVKLLDRVEPNSSDFVEAINIIFRSYLENNQWKKIKELLKKYPKIPVTRSNLSIMYSIAQKLEEEKNYKAAFEIYKKFVEKNLLFRDVKEKYELLKAKFEATKTATKTQEPTTTPTKGSKRKRYQIIRELGRGGMGVVYQAHDTVLDRIVAMKVLPLSLRLNPMAIENFKSEAKKAAALNHPNIVTVYDYGEDEGEYFLVMEYVDGTNLKEYIKKKGRLQLREILFIGVSVAKGLAYAHKSNLLHRDIKPSNIMISIQGKERRIKIADFGLAKSWQDSAKHHTMVVGTPYYMAPEQFLGEKVDERTDIYSFGITLYEMATGEVPFKKGEIGYHHVHTPPPPPHEKAPDINPDLEAIIMKCIKKDPEERFQSMDEVLDAFKQLKEKLR